jgi:hypothetical protein
LNSALLHFQKSIFLTRFFNKTSGFGEDGCITDKKILVTGHSW